MAWYELGFLIMHTFFTDSLIISGLNATFRFFVTLIFIYIYKKISMKTFLVPVDFSATSVNAAEYAVDLTKEIPGVDIILYNVYSRISFPTLGEKEKGSRRAFFFI